MHYLQLTENAEGVSYFRDGEVSLAVGDFAPPAPPLYVSEGEAVSNLVFLMLPAGWHGDWHPSPRRQIAFCLAGRMRVEAGDGAVREIGPGGIWRMEDVAGHGHISAVIGPDNLELAIVQI